jgi:hypothetical protein
MKKISSLIGALALTGLASTANALAIGDANYLGYVTPGEPANAATEVQFINTLLDLANGAGAPTVDCSPPLGDPPGSDTDYLCSRDESLLLSTVGLPDAVVAGAVKIESPANGNVIPDNWEYILAKYGNVSHVWYVGNLTGQTTVPMTALGGGLSHISFYNFTAVPEPGMLSLLGAGLVGVALVRRRRALKA